MDKMTPLACAGVCVCVCVRACVCVCACVRVCARARLRVPDMTAYAVFKNCSSTTDLLLLADPSALRVHDANGDLPLHLAVLELNSSAMEVWMGDG